MIPKLLQLPCRKKLLTSLILLLLCCISYSQIAPTSGEARLNDSKKRKELELRSLVKDIKFRNIGPSIMSGRAVDIDVNPTDPTEFYVAYASGALVHCK